MVFPLPDWFAVHIDKITWPNKIQWIVGNSICIGTAYLERFHVFEQQLGSMNPHLNTNLSRPKLITYQKTPIF